MTARKLSHLVRERDRLRVYMTALAGLLVGLLGGLLLVACSGCSITTYTHGVPNLVQVRPDVYRSGQPISLDQWRYLASLGVRHSIKLDFDDEGTDDLSRLAGIDVYPLGIEPRTNPDGLIPAVAEVFERPAADRIAALKLAIHEIQAGGKGGWLIHCKNGHDRTGLAVGFVRVIVDGWSKAQAWHEMLAHGFHPELVGLLREWWAEEKTP